MKKIIQLLFLGIFLFSCAASAQESESKKVVYDLTTGDLNRFESRVIGGIISHTTFYQNKLEELEVRVIIHGDAYKFFMKDFSNTVYAFDEELVASRADLEKRLNSLAKNYNVTFLVCHAGVKNKKLSDKAFYPFVSMVHNAAIGLIDAQNEGYAYLPLN